MSGRRSCLETPLISSTASTRSAGTRRHLVTAARVTPSSFAIRAISPGCDRNRSMPVRMALILNAYHA